MAIDGDPTLQGTSTDGDVEEAVSRRRLQEQLFERAYEPVRLGRYALLERVGQGAMGLVFAAYDDTLGRKVALKVVRADTASETATERLLREAQAMARLSHANVVHVYEAAREEDQLFIAMEFVDGGTLRGWMHETRRSWRDVVTRFVAIADGLVAAHEAGVVHRDFKPDNVLLTRAGVPKVADFGLAGIDRSVPSVDPELETSSEELSPELTATGAVLGTPAYMAPEQHEGKPAEPASDQFAFCVALHEALYGERPFPAESRPALVYAVMHGEVVDEPAGREVPGWLRSAMLRGLARDPAQRHPSMQALASILRSRIESRRRRTILQLAVAGTLSAAAIAGLAMQESEPDPCRPASVLGDTWSESRRGEVVDALGSVSGEHALRTAERVAAVLDGRATAFAEGYRSACEATRVHQRQSIEVLDLRMQCLDRTLRAIDAAAEVLSEPDPQVLARAIEVAHSVPLVERCADLEYVMARVRPPEDPQVQQSVEAQRRRLARAHALDIAGKYDEAEAIVAQVGEAAEQIAYVPLRVEAQAELGWTRLRAGDYEAAAADLASAYVSADAAGDDETRMSAASALVSLFGHHLRRPEDAARWAELAWACWERLGRPEHVAAQLHGYVGQSLVHERKLDEGLAELREALRGWRALYEETHPNVGHAHNDLGGALLLAGRHDEARTELETALRVWTATLGDGHPDLAMQHANLGIALRELGDHEAADRALAQAHERFVAAFGADHPNVASNRINVGNLRFAQMRYDDAAAEYEAARDGLAAVLGRDHPAVKQAEANLAMVAEAKAQGGQSAGTGGESE